MGPGSIIGTMSHFTTFFAPKLITYFNLLRQKAVDISKTDFCGDISILAPPSAYQEYLVILKLMTSQVVKRVQPYKYMYMHGW